jgi:osmotically-inducible protein OsmY
MNKIIYIFGSLIAITSLSGCAEAIFGGVTTVGAAAVEDRSLGDNLDDRSISAEINHFFVQTDVNNLLKDVSIRVHEGRVLLTGRTANPDVALEAVRLSWQAAGVREVINEIKVGPVGTDLFDYAKDNIIETQIETRLIATKNINGLNYTVEVVDGVAYLLGIARDEEERHNAAYIASITKGVKRVVSYVRLIDDPRRIEKVGKVRDPKVNRK